MSTKRCASFTSIPARPPTSSLSDASPKPRRFEVFSRRPRRSVLTRPARSHTQDDFFAAGKKSPRLKPILGVTALSGTRAAANPVQRLARFLRLGSDVPAFLTTIRVSGLMVPHFSADGGLVAPASGWRFLHLHRGANPPARRRRHQPALPVQN